MVYLDATFDLNCYLLRLFITPLSFSAASLVAVSRYVTLFFSFVAISLSRIFALYSLKSWLSSDIADPSSYSSTSTISNFTVFFFGSADMSFGSPVSYLGKSSSSEVSSYLDDDARSAVKTELVISSSSGISSILTTNFDP